MKSRLSLLTVLPFWSVALSASAGVYTDDLSRCMVESTNPADRTELVKWMFAAAAAHPDVQPFATVSAEQLNRANETMANLLIRLLTVDCEEIARKAFKYEGQVALQSSMQVLGQVAGQELFSSPEVANAMSGLEQHSDHPKLKALLDGE